jgi:ribose transport system ATP-binding protein
MSESSASATEDRGLRIRHLSKQFPGVLALDDVALTVEGGSIHGLLGANGCGKSTLVKVMAGFHAPSSEPEATVDGQPLKLGSAEDAKRAGLCFVHQELGLVPELTAVDNIGLVLGYRRRGFGAISWQAQRDVTARLLHDFDLELDPHQPLSAATPAERAAVAIVRALAGSTPGRGLLVLDEPTAALPGREVEQLFRLIRRVRDSGTAVLVVSHRLDEVMSLTDHVTVMREGRVIHTGLTSDITARALAGLIADDDSADSDVTAVRDSGTGAVTARSEGSVVPSGALTVRGLRGRYVAGIDFDITAGEIVGIAGLLGSGREEIPYLLAGASGADAAGTVVIDGVPMSELSITQAQARGIVLVPADRGSEGIVGHFNVRENVSLLALPRLLAGRTLLPGRESAFARHWLASTGGNPAVIERPITTLSGGNQQKALLARMISIGPKVLILSEPTAGIDIGARRSIYDDLRQRARDGLSVLISSSDTDDLVATCDRVLVLRDGRVVSSLSGSEITKSAIVAAVEGV